MKKKLPIILLGVILACVLVFGFVIVIDLLFLILGIKKDRQLFA